MPTPGSPPPPPQGAAPPASGSVSGESRVGGQPVDRAVRPPPPAASGTGTSVQAPPPPPAGQQPPPQGQQPPPQGQGQQGQGQNPGGPVPGDQAGQQPPPPGQGGRPVDPLMAGSEIGSKVTSVTRGDWVASRDRLAGSARRIGDAETRQLVDDVLGLLDQAGASGAGGFKPTPFGGQSTVVVPNLLSFRPTRREAGENRQGIAETIAKRPLLFGAAGF